MNAETDAFYGRDTPSKTYKWGLVLPSQLPKGLWPNAEFAREWRVVAWFPTRNAAEQYAKRVHGHQPHAIARAHNL
jgi:hypothetical protein